MLSQPTSRPLRRLSLGVILVAAGVVRADPTPIFREATFEELANVTIAAVSRRQERAFDAAAATSVLSGDAVARSGAASLPEALRAVPGLNVAQITPDAWAVGARGFQWQFANKLLVMIDGRSIYSSFLGGVPWEDNPVFLPDLDRVEVVRGPGSSFWGANAVNGVIDIVTRDAFATTGALSFVRVGSQGQTIVGARQGWQLGPHAAVRVFAQHQAAGEGLLPTGSGAGNGFRGDFGGLRFDWAPADRDQVTVQIGGQERRSDYRRTLSSLSAPSPDYLVPIDQPVIGRSYQGSVRWRHLLDGGAEWVVSGYADHQARNRPQFLLTESTRNLDAVFTVPWGSGGHFSAGTGYRETESRTEARLYGFDPANATPQLFNVFANGETPLGASGVKVSGGARVEHNRATGWNLQPTLRLAWQPAENLVGWASLSQAVRNPTITDNTSALDARVFPAGVFTPTLPAVIEVLGNPDLKFERMVAAEAGLRWAPRSSWLVDLAAFAYDYKDYVMLTDAAPRFRSSPAVLVLPQRFENGIVGEAYGGELALNWEPRPGWHLAATGNFVQIQLHTRLPDPLGYEQDEFTTPELSFTLSSDWQIARGWDLHLAARRVGSVPYYGIAAYSELDLRLAWRPNPRLEFSLIARNLLDAWHPEYDSAFNRQLSEMGRTVSLMARWTP